MSLFAGHLASSVGATKLRDAMSCITEEAIFALVRLLVLVENHKPHQSSLFLENDKLHMIHTPAIRSLQSSMGIVRAFPVLTVVCPHPIAILFSHRTSSSKKYLRHNHASYAGWMMTLFICSTLVTGSVHVRLRRIFCKIRSMAKPCTSCITTTLGIQPMLDDLVNVVMVRSMEQEILILINMSHWGMILGRANAWHSATTRRIPAGNLVLCGFIEALLQRVDNCIDLYHFNHGLRTPLIWAIRLAMAGHGLRKNPRKGIKFRSRRGKWVALQRSSRSQDGKRKQGPRREPLDSEMSQGVKRKKGRRREPGPRREQLDSEMQLFSTSSSSIIFNSRLRTSRTLPVSSFLWVISSNETTRPQRCRFWPSVGGKWSSDNPMQYASSRSSCWSLTNGSQQSSCSWNSHT